MPNFAGYKYVEREISLDLIEQSPTQPHTRNEMDNNVRQALIKDIAQNGLKDRVDLIQLANGKFQVVEGHGRVAAYLTLGFTHIPAKVYEIGPGQSRAQLRNAIFEAARTTLKMSGPQWVEYCFREQQTGNEPGAPNDAKKVVAFLSEAFSPTVARQYILDNKVGPAQLNSARAMARDLLGLNAKGKYPETDDAHNMLVNCFRWVVKHGMARAIIEWRAAGRGHAELRRLLDADLPIPKRKKRATSSEAQTSF